MWSPWRYEYIRNLSKELDDAAQTDQSDGNNANFIASYFHSQEQDKITSSFTETMMALFFSIDTPMPMVTCLLHLVKQSRNCLRITKNSGVLFGNLLRLDHPFLKQNLIRKAWISASMKGKQVALACHNICMCTSSRAGAVIQTLWLPLEMWESYLHHSKRCGNNSQVPKHKKPRRESNVYEVCSTCTRTQYLTRWARVPSYQVFHL